MRGLHIGRRYNYWRWNCYSPKSYHNCRRRSNYYSRILHYRRICNYYTQVCKLIIIISLYKRYDVTSSDYRKAEKAETQETPPKPLFIGAHNVFEVACKLESSFGHIGESNVFECRSFVGVDVKIGSGCVIGKTFAIFSSMFI